MAPARASPVLACPDPRQSASQWQPGRALERRGSEIRSLVAGAGTQPPDQVPRLRVSEVGEAIKQLPDEQRIILVLVVVEGMAYDEVAAVLDVPIGTVRSRLARA